MFRDCVCKTVQEAGIIVLRDPKRFSAYISDIATDYPKEKAFLARQSDRKFLSFFVHAAESDGKCRKAAVRASEYLIDTKMIDAEFAGYISSEIAEGVWESFPENKKHVEKKKKPKYKPKKERVSKINQEEIEENDIEQDDSQSEEDIDKDDIKSNIPQPEEESSGCIGCLAEFFWIFLFAFIGVLIRALIYGEIDF